MKIEKINDNQIKCTLNRSDLASHHIKLSELAYGSEKTRGFFDDLMDRANQELGFDAEDDPLMVEAIPVSMDCIVLMVTKVDNPEDFDDELPGSREPNIFFRDEFEDDGEDIFRPQQLFLPGMDGDVMDNLPFLRNLPDQIPDVPETTDGCLYSFKDLDSAIAFAHTVKGMYKEANSLYKRPDDGRFFLLLEKGESDKKQFRQVCASASEFGSREHLGFAGTAFLDEHYEKIIDGKAVQSLANV